MNLVTCSGVLLCFLVQIGTGSRLWGELQKDLIRVGEDYGIKPQENELLETLLEEAVEGEVKSVTPVKSINEVKSIKAIKSIQEVPEDVERSLINQYGNDPAKYDEAEETPDSGVSDDETVKSIRPVTRIERVKSLKPIKSIKGVKSVTPVKSIKEVKSIKAIKSIQAVPDDIARRFIKQHGLISSTGNDPASFGDGEAGGTNESGVSDNEESLGNNEKIELAKGRIHNIKAEIEELERILESEPVDNESENLDGIINPGVEIESIQPIKSILPVKTVDEVKSIEPVKSIKPVVKLTEVTGLYELTDEQAEMLRALNNGEPPSY